MFRKVLGVAVFLFLIGLLAYFLFERRQQDETEGVVRVKKEEIPVVVVGWDEEERGSVFLDGATPEQRARIIIDELRKKGAIPTQTELIDMAKGKDGTIYLNFSSDLSLSVREPMEEIRAVYSIVDSFVLAFPGSQRVQILIEGRAMPTISGLLFTYRPLEPMKEAE